MPKEYDVKDVNIYITDVMRLQPLERVDLWRTLQNPFDEEACESSMVRRFHRQHLATQANILYRFGPIVEKIVRDQAKEKAQVARRAGAM
jgi:hypothetical protein